MLAWVTVTTENQETDWPARTTPLSDRNDLLKRRGPKSAKNMRIFMIYAELLLLLFFAKQEFEN